MEELYFLIVWPLLFMVLLAAIEASQNRYRFSLRVMLVAITLVAVWLGVIMALYHVRR